MSREYTFPNLLFEMKTADSDPNFKEGADRLVVTRLQVHVTSVLELLGTVAPPQDSVAPGRHAALSTAGNVILDHTQSSEELLTFISACLMIVLDNSNLKTWTLW